MSTLETKTPKNTSVIAKITVKRKKAKVAYQFRKKGYTLPEIAKIMGYKSHNSVVVLLKWYEKHNSN